jgi:hypothetical protein
MYELVSVAVLSTLLGGAVWGLGATAAACGLAILAVKAPMGKRRVPAVKGPPPGRRGTGKAPSRARREPYVGIG